MPKLSTADLIHYHLHLAKAKRGPLESEVKELAAAEGKPLDGLDPATVRSLAGTARRVLEMSDFVTDEARRVLKAEEEGRPAAQIEEVREGLAEALYDSFDFGHRVETQSGWDIGPDRWTRPVFLDVGAEETVQVEFGLRFSPGSAEILAYGTEIDEAPAPSEAIEP